MIDITLPAYDTPDAALTPVLLTAIKKSAHAKAHPSDAARIIVTFKHEDTADAFEKQINAILKTEHPHSSK